MKFAYAFPVFLCLFVLSCNGVYTVYERCRSECEKKRDVCMFASNFFSGEFSAVNSSGSSNFNQNVTENASGLHDTYAAAQIITGYSVRYGANITLNGSISVANESDLYKFYLRGDVATRYSLRSLSDSPSVCFAYVGQEQFNNDVVPDPSLQSLGNLTDAELIFPLAEHSVVYFACTSSTVRNYSFQIKTDPDPFPGVEGALIGSALCLYEDRVCKKDCKVDRFGAF
ncbi:hypothetical protein CH379_003180 [Leptospira ellisii]|nr:hypothetical protein [Leptospira ellisii]MDV6234630.1 hypothetical protein [Leptospira ellisii]